MKLYIIPVQNICNAKCVFCITKQKKEVGFGEWLKIESLEKIDDLEIDKIEITGGGEPLLHPEIGKIIKKCREKSFTQMYTNGVLLSKLGNEDVSNLGRLCISRAHWDRGINREIMGIETDDELIGNLTKKVKTKFSAVLCNMGVNDIEEVDRYIQWVKAIGGKEVVFRKMFDYDYDRQTRERLVFDVDGLIKKIGEKYSLRRADGEKFTGLAEGVSIEVELRNCGCEILFPVLRPNGKIYKGWGENEWK